MEKNYSYVSPELDLVEADSYVSCMVCSGGTTGGNKEDQETPPGGGGTETPW